jgi:hypothetical protein
LEKKNSKGFNPRETLVHLRFKKFFAWMLSSTKVKGNGISNKMLTMLLLLNSIPLIYRENHTISFGNSSRKWQSL